MDVGETFPPDCTQFPPTKPLFQVPSVTQTSSQHQSLFPVVDQSSDKDNSDAFKDAELDWLENKSYGDKAAASVLELQKAIAEQEAASADTGRLTESGGGEESSSEEESLVVTKNDVSQDDDVPVEGGPRKRKKKSSKHKHKHKHKKHKSEKNVTTHVSKERTQLSENFTSNTKKVFVEEMHGLEPEDAFRIDRKQDKALWTYESLYKAHIASYRRQGHSALGVLGNQDLFKQEKSPVVKSDIFRYYHKKNRTILKKTGERVKVRQNDSRVEYIPLACDDGKTEGMEGSSTSSTDPHNLMDEATLMYIQGKGVTPADTEDMDTHLDDEILQKVASFNRRLREAPKDVQLWLDFVKFQDHAISSDGGMSGKLKSSQALIDKKLAILNRALTENPGCLELQLSQLEICEDVWESDRVAREWDQLLFVHSANVQLWRRYLLYQQSRLSSFSVSKMTKLYHKCFHVLTAVMEGQVNTVRSTEDLPSSIVAIFHQYCTFLQQAGQTERAVASYQAQIEFNIFCPPSLEQSPVSDRIAVFESFWDSSVPRFGEKGARGWTVWSKEKSQTETEVAHTENTEDTEEQIISQNLPTWKTWLQIETLRERSHWFPWRPDLSKNETEEDCEDLERLVLVDDIMPVLFRLPCGSSHFRLVLGFLQLLGVDTQDVLCDLCLEQKIKDEDSFIQMFLDKLFQIPAVSTLAKTVHCWSFPSKPVSSMDTGFDETDQQWTNDTCFGGTDQQWKVFPPLQIYITDVLAQSVKCFSGHHQTVFTLLQIQFECAKHGISSLKNLPKVKSKELRKFIKNLLKENRNRNNLTVWNAYTWLEWELGRTSDALGIVETALGMFSGSSCEDKAGLSLLYQTYCQLLLNYNRHLNIDLSSKQQIISQVVKTKVLSCLTFLAEVTRFKVETAASVSTSTVLKTRRKLQARVAELLQQVLAVSDHKIREDVESCQHLLTELNCLAMFDLLASDLDSALSHFSTVLTHLSANSTPQECLMILKYNICRCEILLVQNYMSSSVVPLCKLRSSLEKALKEFPNSPEFLKCLIDIESRSHIVGRLRRYVDKALTSPKTPVVVIIAVLAEVHRMSVLQEEGTILNLDQVKDRWSKTGMVHWVRRLLERGTHNPVSQHCPLVWRLYYNIERLFGDEDRVRGVFYRGLQQCPWNKLLYLDGVQLFGGRQLQELVDLMTEKELRVQIPVEELELLTQSEPAPRAAPVEEESTSDGDSSVTESP